MPEAMNLAGEGAYDNLRPTIEAFYDALIGRDGERLGQIVDEHFAGDAVLERPESLPGGGRTAGAGRIKRLLAGAAGMEDGPLDVEHMEKAQVLECGSEHVVVELRFPFAGEPTSSLEWWTVRDLKVVSLRAFYWDTAAMLAASG